MKIQEKIRFLRESKDLSQDDVAEKIGLTRNGYAKIERGETKATYPRLEKIAKALNVDLMELLTLGEKNVACLISDNNNGTNNISQNENVNIELAFEIQKLQLTVQHKDELLAQQKERLDGQKQEIAILKEMLELLNAVSRNP